MVEYKSVVLKFGGSVIPDEQAIINVANIIKDLSAKYKIKAVVVSAMGKTTNNLDALAHRVASKPDARELDALLATGEMQSTALLSMRLNDIGVFARGYNAKQFRIKAEGEFGAGWIKSIDIPYLSHKMLSREIPVVAGFQGVTKFGDFITLGREGSDITAVVVAANLKADFVWFFKDGGGIYDKNPQKFADAKILDHVSYKKMLGLLNTNNRNQVLHAKSVNLAEHYNMPLLVTDINLDRATWVGKQINTKLR